MTQAGLFDARRRMPAFGPRDVDVLIDYLRGKGWRTAKQIRGERAFTERELRALASASQGRVISGQAGYCLIEEATVQEAQHAADWLKSQARLMLARAMEIERALHRRAA